MLVELHCHTNASDGLEPVGTLLKKAATCVGGIAITDHNTMAGYRKAVALKSDLVIIPALEISSQEGHILAFGVHQEIRPGLSVPETIDAIHDQSGIAVAAHPFGNFLRLGVRQLGHLELFDAVEAVNGMCLPYQNTKAQREAARLKKPMIAGSDAHTLGEFGRFACNVHGEDVDSLLTSIRKGRVTLPKAVPNTFYVLSRKLGRKAYRFAHR